MSVSTNPIVSNGVVAPIDRTAATPPISFGGDAQKRRAEVNELKRVKSGDVVVVPFKKAVGK